MISSILLAIHLPNMNSKELHEEILEMNKSIQNVVAISLQLSWPRGPILWGTASSMWSFGLAKYAPDRPSMVKNRIITNREV